MAGCVVSERGRRRRSPVAGRTPRRIRLEEGASGPASRLDLPGTASLGPRRRSRQGHDAGHDAGKDRLPTWAEGGQPGPATPLAHPGPHSAPIPAVGRRLAAYPAAYPVDPARPANVKAGADAAVGTRPGAVRSPGHAARATRPAPSGGRPLPPRRGAPRWFRSRGSCRGRRASRRWIPTPGCVPPPPSHGRSDTVPASRR